VRMIGCFESSASPSDRRANAGSHSLRTPLQREHNTARRSQHDKPHGQPRQM
jgi:hypothetical protein